MVEVVSWLFISTAKIQIQGYNKSQLGTDLSSMSSSHSLLSDSSFFGAMHMSDFGHMKLTSADV